MSKAFYSSTTIFVTAKRFFVLNFGISTILMLIFCPSCFLSLEGIRSIVPDWIFSFLMSSSLSFGGFKVEEYFDKKISWIEKPVKRLLLMATSYMIYSFIVSFILIFFYVWITVEEVTLTNIDWMRILKNTLLPTFIAFIIITIFTARSWLYEWKNAAIEAEQLKSENLASQYQSLKDQLNPHFLFNSLNVLTNLVYESPDKSAAFIQQLSKIYRYVLEVQEEELVTMEQELGFAENFLSLQKIRFEKSLEYTIEVHEYKEFFLPPLSLQLLMENAIKHNIISLEQPLKILIVQEKDTLLVKNRLQPKLTQEIAGNGIGLSNIEKRYAILSERKPKIMQTEKEFIVELPLLKT
ncbi:sensor histidine kinase [Pleomorphovibrio marinus]|uniref:sensor histidine kinase n=1 Tax=Pleomorphovibrio marinus TaxID=2164132 RepID=UPI000E0A2EF4|nr:histidine kinase [Pleomorphovibrio marinus]